MQDPENNNNNKKSYKSFFSCKNTTEDTNTISSLLQVTYNRQAACDASHAGTSYKPCVC